MDNLNLKDPTGHAGGVRTSTWLTQSVKHTHRKHAIIISPRDVILVLVATGMKNTALSGLHGYVGYLPETRHVGCRCDDSFRTSPVGMEGFSLVQRGFARLEAYATEGAKTGGRKGAPQRRNHVGALAAGWG